MFYYIESVGSELCGAMLPQSSVLSCPISRLVPAELAPGRKKLARRNDGAISDVPPSGPFISPSRSREPGWPGGGGLWLQHFPLENAAPPQLHTQGMSSCSPLPKDSYPFVGRGALLWVELQAAQGQRRNRTTAATQNTQQGQQHMPMQQHSSSNSKT